MPFLLICCNWWYDNDDDMMMLMLMIPSLLMMILNGCCNHISLCSSYAYYVGIIRGICLAFSSKRKDCYQRLPIFHMLSNIGKIITKAAHNNNIAITEQWQYNDRTMIDQRHNIYRPLWHMKLPHQNISVCIVSSDWDLSTS